jgi:hypothetical protein
MMVYKVIINNESETMQKEDIFFDFKTLFQN